ncbi:MAG: formylglycine-generating enzyme family protein, partial [Planctomycetes bacterium]|nr:formylglycine-generating enzyme family protein [Planctomycetota bacterium]
HRQTEHEITQQNIDEFKVPAKSIDIKLVSIPAGEFMMGSPLSEKGREDYEGPQHRVKISKGFYMGAYEVTQAQYEAIMGSNPSQVKGDNLPVGRVSWEMAMGFCRKLSQKEGRAYRLPTEAEWEYACRAGTATAYSFGNSSSSIGDYAWCGDYSSIGNYDREPRPVGQKKPNSFGLHDMHGNLMEWCLDRYDEDENYYTNSPGVDPQGPSSSMARIWDFRVLRGGCRYYFPEQCRSASREWLVQESGGNGTGFRVVSPDASGG